MSNNLQGYNRVNSASVSNEGQGARGLSKTQDETLQSTQIWFDGVYVVFLLYNS